MIELSLSAVAGFVVGWYSPRIYGIARSAYYHLKGGICFRYLYGPREWREGTLSNFCRRCGQPAGSHRWGVE